MDFSFPTRSIHIPAELILLIAGNLTKQLHEPWTVGTGCCGPKSTGPCEHLCGRLPDVAAAAATSEMRALANTCRTLRKILHPLAYGALSVRLEQGLCPEEDVQDKWENRSRWFRMAVLRRREGYYYSADVLPTDELLEMAELPHQGTDVVRSLHLAMRTWTFPHFKMEERRSGGHPDDAPAGAEDIQGPRGGAAILRMYPALHRLNLSVQYGHCGNVSRLRGGFLSAVSSLQNLRELNLYLVSLGPGMPSMPSVQRIHVHNAHISCWDSFPNLVDVRMESQSLFGEALYVPWYVLRRLEHLTFCPPDDIDDCEYLPNQCRVSTNLCPRPLILVTF
jgi:hypothetical protein